jgi:predicted metalloprotease with PDZ domain
MSSKLPAVWVVLAVPLLLMLSAGGALAADLLRYTVRFDPFEVELTLPSGAKEKRELPRQATYFLHRANNRWPIPDGPAGRQVRCEVRWIGLPADWRLVTSFGIDRRVERFETTLGRLRKAVFAAGDFRIARSKRGMVLVTRGSWKLSDAEFLTLMDRIAEPHTALWRDRGVGGHRVFLLPSSKNWGGEGRTKGLVVEGSPDTFEQAAFARLLSHELFHEWNPRRLHSADDETLYWFTEGFTDYYAVASVWRSGLWSFEQVLEYSNEVARLYYTSPMRNLTPDRMVALRQSNTEANELPYRQGFLLAAHWNGNGSGKSLDLAMRNLMKDNGEPLSNSRITRALRSIGIEKAEEEVQQFVVEGRTISLRPNLWGACAAETRKEFARFDMGFDVKESEKSKIIHGVKQDSNAWRAGVRDGQKWTPRDVVWGDASYLAGIDIEDEQGKRRIQYYPASATTFSVPQYKANTARCDPWTLTPVSAPR